ncbi:MAG TPA: hypothetical protein VF761_10320 [Gemmatimonadaceae bacterium]
MSERSIARELEALLREHRRDADGGDALVRAVIDHARSRSPAERDQLMSHLLGLVAAETPELWPIALESLVRAGSEGTAGRLGELFASEPHSPEWADLVMVAILRLGNAEVVAQSREWVREELARYHAGALPMLAWLYREDRESALELGARFFAGALGARPAVGERLRGEIARHIPGQLEGLLAGSTGAVLDLVDRVASIDANAGRALAAMIAAALRDPAARDRFGTRAVSALGEAMRLRAG